MARLSDSAVARLRAMVEWPDLAGTRYEPLKVIGRGGMGIVYLARDNQLERDVAVKVLDAAAVPLPDEARILARLEHPGIVPVHDAGVLPDGRPYYAMKLVEGTRMDVYRDRHPPLPELLRTFCRVCEPVAFAHSQGVIHRDLKPENIMVGRFGEVLVLDWGVAGASGAAPAGGTRDYMAPEPAAGARSDVYSLGKTLAFLLSAGERVPKPLAAICRKAAAPDPAARYAGPLEMAADIERFLDGLPVAAYREPLWERGARFLRRNKMPVALVLAYLTMRFLLFLYLGR